MNDVVVVLNNIHFACFVAGLIVSSFDCELSGVVLLG